MLCILRIPFKNCSKIILNTFSYPTGLIFYTFNYLNAYAFDKRTLFLDCLICFTLDSLECVGVLVQEISKIKIHYLTLSIKVKMVQYALLSLLFTYTIL